ncbi:hypothetical protein D3C84_784750 [compost metagenome]
MAFGLALPGLELNLLQVDFAQVAGKRARQREGARRAICSGLKMTEILAVGVGHLTVESAQRHFRLIDQRVQSVPREVQPVDFSFSAQGFAPIQLPGELEALFFVGDQVQRGDLCAIGVDLALQCQRNRAFLGRQTRLAL